MDVSEAGNPGIMARQVQVTGNLMGGGTVSTTLVLDLNLVDMVTANYFQTFLFGPAWTNLSSVTLNGVNAQCCGAIPGNYYGIDNIAVDVGSPVAEPATLSLFGIGSAYLVARRRRNRR